MNERFEDWLIKTFPDAIELSGMDCVMMHLDFKNLPLTCQWGIFKKYFLMHNLLVYIKPRWADTRTNEMILVFDVIVNDQPIGVWGDMEQAIEHGSNIIFSKLS